MDKEYMGKTVLLEVLDYLRFKVEKNRLTMEEVESIAQLVEENLVLVGTAEDFSEFYGQSESNVRNVINRSVMEKPERKVFYRFGPFRKAVPKSWKNRQKNK